MLVVALASLGGVISTLPWPCVTAPQQLGGGGAGLSGLSYMLDEVENSFLSGFPQNQGRT